MRSRSSGLLESLAVGLSFIVALAAIYGKDGDAPVCHAERVAIAPQPAATPAPSKDGKVEAEIKDMRLHD